MSNQKNAGRNPFANPRAIAICAPASDLHFFWDHDNI